MKKITDFIVNNRYIVFGLVLLMSFGCIFLFDDIKINRDISKYLPKTSEVREMVLIYSIMKSVKT